MLVFLHCVQFSLKDDLEEKMQNLGTLTNDRRHFCSDDLQLNDGDLLALVCDSLQGCAPKYFDDTTGNALGLEQVFHEPLVDCRRRSLDR